MLPQRFMKIRKIATEMNVIRFVATDIHVHIRKIATEINIIRYVAPEIRENQEDCNGDKRYKVQYVAPEIHVKQEYCHRDGNYQYVAPQIHLHEEDCHRDEHYQVYYPRDSCTYQEDCHLTGSRISEMGRSFLEFKMNSQHPLEIAAHLWS